MTVVIKAQQDTDPNYKYNIELSIYMAMASEASKVE